MDYLKNFKIEAMEMWKTKYIKKYNRNVLIFKEDAILLKGEIENVDILRFEQDGLTIYGYEGAETIPYNKDELIFIKSIEKTAKIVDVKPLKTLTALKNNIIIRKFNDFKKHDDFFIKSKNMIFKHLRDNSKIFNDLKLKVKEPNLNDTVYYYEIDYISLKSKVHMKIHKIKINKIEERSKTEWRINDDYITNKYIPLFTNENDAKIAFLWNFWGYNYDIVKDREIILTKIDKVNYVKNMTQYEKWLKKYPNEMSKLYSKLGGNISINSTIKQKQLKELKNLNKDEPNFEIIF